MPPADPGTLTAAATARGSLRRTFHRLSAPADSTPVRRRNFELTQLDSVAIGVMSAASTFLPVFLVRLGAGPFAVGLLATLPALGGLLLAVPIGRIVERRGRIVRWWSVTRLVQTFGYALSALIAMVAVPDLVVPLCLVVWAVMAVPQTVSAVCFPIVMDGAAGPAGRYDLMGRRWAIMGLATAVSVALAGILLDLLPMPANYELVLVIGTLSGFVSYRWTSRVAIEEPAWVETSHARLTARRAVEAIRAHREFLGFVNRKGVFTAGVRAVTTILPLYYVRTIDASDAWIGVIAMGQGLAMVVGYAYWRRQSRRMPGRTLLLWTLGVSGAIPAALAVTSSPEVVLLLSAIGAFFASGSDLALFDELMVRLPRDHAVTFAGVDSALTNLAGIIAPIAAAVVVAGVGLEWALVAGAAVSLLGLVLFVRAPAPMTLGAPPGS